MIRALMLCLLMTSSAEAADFYFKQSTLPDFLEAIYGDHFKQPYTLDSDVLTSDKVITLNWVGLSDDDLKTNARQVLKNYGYDLMDKAGVYTVKKADAEPSKLFYYVPKYRSAAYLQKRLRITLQGRTQLNVNGDQSQAMQPANSASSNLANDDSDMVSLYLPESQHQTFYTLATLLDKPAGQVEVKAAIYEVQTNSAQASAISVVASFLSDKLGVKIDSGITGTSSISIGALGINAVMSALDRSDSFSLISSPQVRVLDGKSARFNVGASVPVLGQIQLDSRGNPLQSINYQPSGVTLEVKPKVYTDLTELEVTQELSSFTSTTTGVNNSPTLLTRSVTSSLTMVDKEVVIIAGLKSDQKSKGKSLLPFLKLPIGSSSSTQDSEVLIILELTKV